MGNGHVNDVRAVDSAIFILEEEIAEKHVLHINDDFASHVRSVASVVFDEGAVLEVAVALSIHGVVDSSWITEATVRSVVAVEAAW